MYICKECGCEYKTKPDYCDCGNDCFDEVLNTDNKNKTSKPIYFSNENILSWIVFVVCIILSIVVLLFFPKVTETPEKTSTQQTKIVRETNPNIPDIDTFWINSKPQVQEPQSPVEQIKEIFTPKPAPKPVAKPTQQAKPVQKTQQAKKQTQQKSTTQTKQVKQVQTSQQKQQSQQQTTRSNPYEFTNYKSALAQKLISNINVLNVKGTGRCSISFAIDSTGKLTNKSFTMTSDNKSVNDEVYRIFMLTPRYSPPPSSYDGRTLELTFEFDNGSYRVRYTR